MKSLPPARAHFDWSVRAYLPAASDAWLSLNLPVIGRTFAGDGSRPVRAGCVPVTHSDIFAAWGNTWLDGLDLPQPYAGKVARCGS